MTSTAEQRAQQTASTAADEGRHVAATAQGEAQQLAHEVQAQAQTIMDDAMRQVHDQSSRELQRLAGTLRTLGQDLERMSGSADSGLATDLTRQLAQRAQDLSRRLDGREPEQLLDEVRGYARRRPGVFLAGALAAGVVAGRLVRGGREAQQQGGQGQAASQGQGVPQGTTHAQEQRLGSQPPYASSYGQSTPGHQTQPGTAPAGTGPVTTGTEGNPEVPRQGGGGW